VEAKVTLLYTDALFLQHDTGRHPENAGRLTAISSRLEQTGLAERCTPGAYQPLDEQALTAVHEPQVIAQVKWLAAHGGGHLDPDTVVSPASFEVARAAAGACVAAVDAVLAGQDQNALCLVRPPGHHATPDRSMGFCLFNNVALAAHHARHARGLDRVLIVDWDVHHGNGTQNIFYADDTVFFFSIHRSPFYPGTGAASETGTGRGLGATLNVPVRFGTSRAEYLDRFTRALHRAADTNRPELVLVSAGFDAHALDPIGSLGLEVEDFATLTRLVLEVAQAHAKGRLVSCLEGGYNVHVLPDCVAAHLHELLAAKRPPAGGVHPNKEPRA
jgi:acetoin utilization deacetylase AcuC-like enzyme